MSDIELPDYGVQTDLSMDIEKGIFLRKKNSNLTDNESNDSGNNSMNTNGSGTYQFVLYWNFLHKKLEILPLFSKFINKIVSL